MSFLLPLPLFGLCIWGIQIGLEEETAIRVKIGFDFPQFFIWNSRKNRYPVEVICWIYLKIETFYRETRKSGRRQWKERENEGKEKKRFETRKEKGKREKEGEEERRKGERE